MKKLAFILSMVLVFAVGCANEAPEAGDTVQEQEQSNSIEVTLNSAEITKEDKYDELEEGQELLVVNISIMNNSEEVYEFNPTYLTLEVNGESISDTSISPKDKDNMHMANIESGEAKTGIVSFEVDEGTTDYGLVYEDFNGNKIVLK